jgi:hypothetical protein
MSSSSRNTVNESTEPITFQKILESTRHRSALRKSLAAHEDAKDGYARRLKAFLAKVDAISATRATENNASFFCANRRPCGRHPPSTVACCSLCFIRS